MVYYILNEDTSAVFTICPIKEALPSQFILSRIHALYTYVPSFVLSFKSKDSRRQSPYLLLSDLRVPRSSRRWSFGRGK